MSNWSFSEKYPGQTQESLMAKAKKIATTVAGLGEWGPDNGAYVVFAACAKEQALFAGRAGAVADLDDYILKWLIAFSNGYANRGSQRHGKAVQTVADSMINCIVAAAFSQTTAQADLVVLHHRQAMAAENILGHLLEEYIASSVAPQGWFCCWGTSVRAVDFCSKDGRLLQVKNRDNSENSSSVKVRDGTVIEMWFRTYSQTGATNWPKLQAITGSTTLSEEGFKQFVQDTFKANPKLLSA